MEIPSFGKRQSVWKKWLFSYLTVLSIPFLISIVLFSRARGAISDEVIRANSATLQYAINDIDSTAEAIHSVLVSLVNDTNVSDLLKLEPDELAFRNQLPYTVGAVAGLVRAVPDTEILIYLPESDNVITPSTANPSPLIYASMVHSGKIGIRYDRYVEQLCSASGGYQWSLSQGIAYADGLADYVTLSISIPAHSFISVSKNAANFFVMVKLTDFTSSLLYRPENGLLIYDGQGKLISSFNCTVPEGFSLQDTLTHNVRLHDSAGSYICSGAQSASCGWSFVVVTPEAQLYGSVNRFQTMALLFFGAVLVIGLCVIFFILQRNYRPVRKAMETLGIPVSSSGDQDEFELMQHTYADLYYRNQDLSQKLASRRDTQRKNYLFALLHGNRPLLSDEDVQENVGLDLSEKAFAIVVFSTELDAGADTLEAAAYSIGLLTQQKADPVLKCYTYFEDQLICCLFLTDAEKAPAFPPYLTQLSGEILQSLKSTLNIAATAVVGDCCTDFAQLHNQFRLSMEAVQYQFVTHRKGLLPVSELNGAIAPAPDAEEQEKLSLLCEAVAACKFGDAQAVALRLFESISACSEHGFEIDRFRVFSWVSAVADAALQLWPKKGTAISAALTQMAAEKDCVALREDFCQLLQKLCSENSKATEYNVPLSVRVEQYILSHYSDSNLCLSTLGEIMSLSPKYLSQLFRSETGTGLLDFLNQVRIRSAKELLASGTHTIAEVSELVGYTNVKTFRRTFLKLEGCNPSQSERESENG